jgi:hypothetical protein
MILIASCNQTLLALDAAANILDSDLTADLRQMIARSEQELAEMNEKLAALRG